MDAKLFAALAQPFPAADVGFKPQAVKDNRGKPVAYIDARAVMDRLDEVVGGENWQDCYEVVRDAQGKLLGVQCTLSVRVPGTAEWITKADVGSPSAQPDPSDQLKAAYSDALKRAAVKFGVGRYLYSIDLPWQPINQYKKFDPPPQLPAWALPKVKTRKVSADQANELSELAGAADVEVSSVLSYYHVESLTDLDEEQYKFLKGRWSEKAKKVKTSTK
jgi:hypothetical protein